MADFFENLKKNLTETAEKVAKKTGEVADVVAKKTEDVVEVTKLKNQIRTMERNNERDLTDIGKMIYESYKNGEEVDAKFTELCAAIKEREEEIVKLDKEVAELKGKDVCPECKNYVESDAAFCPKCGAKVECAEVVEEAAEEAEEDVFEEE